jgi:predicted nucleic-acid-binding protein
VKITADTNILVRAATLDDAVQGPLAQKLMKQAETVAVTLPALCEFCWVLGKVYRYESERVAASIRLLIDAGNIAVDRQAVEAGLAVLDEGGDFADGIIAHEGQWLGGETFVSFDREAVGLLQKQGQAAIILK